jgi:hypothetical protein
VEEPRPGTFDPDLDLNSWQPAAGSDESIEDYQRLIANPFLAVLAWLTTFWLLRESLRRQNMALFLAGSVLFFGAFFLLHCHCVDCGATRWLLRSGLHACSAVVDRRQSRSLRRRRWPRISTQVAMLFIVTLTVFVLGLAVRGSGR